MGRKYSRAIVMLLFCAVASAGDLEQATKTYAVYAIGQPIPLRMVYNGKIDKWDARPSMAKGKLTPINAFLFKVATDKGKLLKPKKGMVTSSLWNDSRENASFDVTVDVSKLYDLSKPGAYTIEWGCENVKTTTIHIQVKK